MEKMERGETIGKKSLAFFTFEKCSPCKNALPIARDVASEEKVDMEIIDIIEDNKRFREIDTDGEIHSFPTICTIENGKIGKCIRGFPNEELYRKELKELLEEGW
jgi:thiol-disulfide isomerase/thioredoxin